MSFFVGPTVAAIIGNIMMYSHPATREIFGITCIKLSISGRFSNLLVGVFSGNLLQNQGDLIGINHYIILSSPIFN